MKQNYVLSNKIEKNVGKVVMKNELNFHELQDSMKKLNYGDRQAEEIFKCIQQSGKVHRSNLIRFLNLVENIYLPKFICSDDFGTDQRKFGMMKNGQFFIQLDQDVKKIANHFSNLVANRKEAEAKLIREKEELFTKNKFAPTICRKSA